MDNQEIKVGAVFTVNNRPSMWSSGRSNKNTYPLNCLEFPYTSKVEEVEYNKDYITIRDSNGYGWGYCKETLSCFNFSSSNINYEIY